MMAMNILVVDDDPAIYHVLERVLRKEGHNPMWAGSGHYAVRLLCTEKIDLVLLDMNLGPGMSGYDVARVKKHDPKLRAIPMIVISGTPGEDVRQEARENVLEGVSFYIEKPFDDLSVLMRIIASIATPSKSPSGELD
jgi:CheY-like chemotaxis protein